MVYVYMCLYRDMYMHMYVYVFVNIGMICLVVAIFFWVGWKLGAIEAICLSILVGSSVDYCVHVVEGYVLAGRSPPRHLTQVGRSLIGLQLRLELYLVSIIPLPFCRCRFAVPVT